MTEERNNLTEKETTLIKSTFTGNEDLLKTMRALFLGLGISAEEKETIRSTFKNDALLAVICKRFLPTLEKGTPIGQVQDVWLGAEQMIFAQARDTIYQAIQYKEMSIAMTKKALALLTDPDGESIDVAYAANKYLQDDLGINLLARNQFIRHIEQQLLFLWMIAGQPTKTPEEVKKQAKADNTQ